MEVICKGYKTCKNRNWCSHSKPHKFKEDNGDYCYNEEDYIDKNCICTSSSIRKLKLEKIKNNG